MASARPPAGRRATWLHAGVHYPPIFDEQALVRIRDSFPFRTSDVLVASYPKAGTTWVMEIIYALVNGPGAADKRDESLDQVFPYLEVRMNASGSKLIENLPEPRLFKTHLPVAFYRRVLDDPDACPRIVLVLRNPKDLYVSHFHFLRTLRLCADDWEDFLLMNKQKEVPYGDYFDHVREWAKAAENNTRIHIVKYEDLKMETIVTIKKLAEFLKIETTMETIESIVSDTSFSTMKSRDPKKYFSTHTPEKGFDFSHFFRKGMIGDWCTMFSVEESDLIDQECETHLTPFGITFNDDI